jgi:NifU-like protein
MHCSVMGREALEAAIANYRGDAPEAASEARVVCTCFGVTEPEIERAIRENGLSTVEDVTNYTKAGGGCGGCHAEIEEILERVNGPREARGGTAEPNAPRMTTIRKIRLIEETLDREIRPMLKKDGGDIELLDLDGNRVVVAMRGRCTRCRVAGVTLKDMVQPKLREFVSPDLVVEEEDA